MREPLKHSLNVTAILAEGERRDQRQRPPAPVRPVWPEQLDEHDNTREEDDPLDEYWRDEGGEG